MESSSGGRWLENVRFSPGGRQLKNVKFSPGGMRLVDKEEKKRMPEYVNTKAASLEEYGGKLKNVESPPGGKRKIMESPLGGKQRVTRVHMEVSEQDDKNEKLEQPEQCDEDEQNELRPLGRSTQVKQLSAKIETTKARCLVLAKLRFGFPPPSPTAGRAIHDEGLDGR